MRRTNPVGTIAGYGFTLLLLVVLGLALLLTGGRAFSPGKLTARTGRNQELQGFGSHAEFEGQCDLCHQPLVRPMSDLCSDCHQNVAEEVQTQSGLHGKLEDARRCRTCHSDHQGVDFSPAQAALSRFDHQVTDFSLVHHQVDYDAGTIDCADCHDQENPEYGPQERSCFGCHTVADPRYMEKHLSDFGGACLDCHDGVDQMAGFDHASTKFLLDGRHTDVECKECHVGAAQAGGQRFVGLATACVDCHAEPSIHMGLFSQGCEECHVTSGWSPARLDGNEFDHDRTGFSLIQHTLNYDGSALTCKGCHIQDLVQLDQQVCIDCHTNQDAVFMGNHALEMGLGPDQMALRPADQKGKYCTACHDGTDRMIPFDHNQVFLLDGRHAEVACASCHGADPLTMIYTGLPGRCVDCHAEPEIHAGFFGVECQECHESSAWSPAFLKEHDFPLDHGAQAPSECTVCHVSVFTEYTCYGCHEHTEADIIEEHAEEGISSAELPACAECHPTGHEDE